MKVFDCDFTIYADNSVQKQRIQAPALVLKQQFASLLQEAASTSKPVKVVMSRKEPIYDNFSNEVINRENSVSFMNNAYIDAEEHKK